MSTKKSDNQPPSPPLPEPSTSVTEPEAEPLEVDTVSEPTRRRRRRKRGRPKKRRHHKYVRRKSPYRSGQEKLDRFRGIDTVQQSKYRLLDGEGRKDLVKRLEEELDRDLKRIVPVEREEWTPQRLAIASGLSVSQITRVFHDDPSQQRWRHFAHDLKFQAIGYKLPPDKAARVMALCPGHRYCQQSRGILLLARAMGIKIEELVEILLGTV